MTDPRTTTTDVPVTVEQIKPCPFCASPGKMIHPMGIWAAEYARPGHAGGYGPNGSRIVCTSDECSGCGRAFYGPDQDAEAIGQWNTRLAALASAPAGDGYVLMPRHATRAMVEAADACTDAYSAYAAMVEAAHVR